MFVVSHVAKQVALALEKFYTMRKGDSVLAIDVGGGTQDILLYEEGIPIENCVKLILPSPTVVVARKIERATESGKDIFLTGPVMGGGRCVGAMKKHIQAGLKVFATPESAMTIRDNLIEVKSMGIKITEEMSPSAEVIQTGDVNLKVLRDALEPFEVQMPSKYAVAVLDHGYSPTQSNRAFRFEIWRKFIDSGGYLKDLIYQDIPPHFTRMMAIKDKLPGAILMDTGSAALWGALCDSVVAAQEEKGLTIVNIGNQHILAVLVYERRVWGLFEHHTCFMDTQKLADYVQRLRNRSLSHEEVFEGRGHGCLIASKIPESANFSFVVVLGPNRAMAEGLDYYFAVPHGDMMLAGCFGLVEAMKAVCS